MLSVFLRKLQCFSVFFNGVFQMSGTEHNGAEEEMCVGVIRCQTHRYSRRFKSFQCSGQYSLEYRGSISISGMDSESNSSFV